MQGVLSPNHLKFVKNWSTNVITLYSNKVKEEKSEV